MLMNRLDQVKPGELHSLELELKVAVRVPKGAYRVYDHKKNIGSWDYEHWTHFYALLEMATNEIRSLTNKDNQFCEDITAIICIIYLTFMITNI